MSAESAVKQIKKANLPLIDRLEIAIQIYDSVFIPRKNELLLEWCISEIIKQYGIRYAHLSDFRNEQKKCNEDSILKLWEFLIKIFDGLSGTRACQEIIANTKIPIASILSQGLSYMTGKEYTETGALIFDRIFEAYIKVHSYDQVRFTLVRIEFITVFLQFCIYTLKNSLVSQQHIEMAGKIFKDFNEHAQSLSNRHKVIFHNLRLQIFPIFVAKILPKILEITAMTDFAPIHEVLRKTLSTVLFPQDSIDDYSGVSQNNYWSQQEDPKNLFSYQKTLFKSLADFLQDPNIPHSGNTYIADYP